MVKLAPKKYPQYKWLFQPMDRTRYDIFANKGKKGVHRKAGLQIEDVLFEGIGGFSAGPEQEFREYMLDVYALANADGLVGKFSSSLDSLAYALQTAHNTEGGMCMKPYISMDAPWCFDFRPGSSPWCGDSHTLTLT